MKMYIEVQNGPDKDIRFEIKAGLKLGRRKVDYIVQDIAASGFHAIIREKSLGEYYLIDNNSKNGTKLDGIREDAIELLPNIIFEIGATKFKILQDLPDGTINTKAMIDQRPPLPFISTEILKRAPGDIDDDPFSLIKPVPTPPEFKNDNVQKEIPKAPADEVPAKDKSKFIDIKVELNWNDRLEEFSQQKLGKIRNNEKILKPLNPAIKLTFIKGIQTDTEWLLGYGPRVIGAHEYDLTIFENEAPAKCFEIIPTHLGLNFKTNHPKIVMYNGRWTEQCLIKNGDKIQIGETTIKVELIP